MVLLQLVPWVTADYAAWCVCMLTTFWVGKLNVAHLAKHYQRVAVRLQLS